MSAPRPTPDLDALAEDLAAWLPRQRWFAGKDRGAARVEVVDFAGLGDRLVLIVAEAVYDDGSRQRYQVPLAAVPGAARYGAVTRAGEYAFVDAIDDDDASRRLALLAGSRRRITTAAGAQVTGDPVETVPRPGPARRLDVEQSNSSVVFGETLILKLLRRLEPGESPEVELTRALTEAGSAHTPALRGVLTAAQLESGTTTLAVLSDFVGGGRDGWDLVTRGAASPGLVRELGAAVARVHADLARVLGSSPATAADVEGWSKAMRAQLDRVLAVARRREPETTAPVLEAADRIEHALGRIADVTDPGVLTRIHGDLHLGQVMLDAQGRWQLLDFEGEPHRGLAERRAPSSPLRDVAGMLRSFDYTVGHGVAQAAADELRAAFLAGYGRPGGAGALLDAFELDKAVYELGYELGSRPDWVGIPVAGILRILNREGATAMARTVPAEPLPTVAATTGWHASAEEVALLRAGRHDDPHRILGVHPYGGGAVVRAYRPEADTVDVVLRDGRQVRAEQTADGLFEALLDSQPSSYRLRVRYPGGEEFTLYDPYAFWPTLGDLDLHLAGEGRHVELWQRMGAHVGENAGIAGTSFAVWAPNARSVRVVGDLNSWDGRLHPMRRLGSSGIWELFVPEVGTGALYKYELVTADGSLVAKADPYALAAEVPPGTASRVYASGYTWGDAQWMDGRGGEPATTPLSIYEVHLGSWRHRDGRPLSYRQLADDLIGHVTHLGFTHVEFLPVAEHPFGGSWGYQVTGYFAPTSRYGDPDDFRYLVDRLHQAGIGVIVDWVPAHFPRDEWALARFDGTALYEHADPRQGEHPDWGTLVFNFGRNEVRNFLIANALYWLEELHVDGLRVDAVASMIYLDYSRKEGEWVPNRYGGRESLEAIEFLKELNREVYARNPHAMVIAEESTAWPGVSRPVHLGGLGFGFKWNMGWMHDTLEYFTKDPVHRRYHHHQLTFGLLYAFTENFILPFSHDEVVHGKRSLLDKMPGDRWQRFANLRSLYGYMWAHPGKQLLFMGGEFGQWREWSEERELDWWLLDEPDHLGLQTLVSDLNARYRELPTLWQRDSEPLGFTWIDANNADDNVVAFYRRGSGGGIVACVGNFSPVPRRLRVGLPEPGVWREVLNTDAQRYGGGNVGNLGEIRATGQSWHGQPASAELTLPPLATIWLVRE